MRKNRFYARIAAMVLLTAIVAGCGQTGGGEETDPTTKNGTGAADSTGTSQEVIDAVHLDGGGFTVDWHEEAELTDDLVYPEAVLPERYDKTDDYLFAVYEDHVVICLYYGSETFVTVPSEYDGLPVTKIGEDKIIEDNMSDWNPFKGTDVEEVVLPEGILEIGELAFGDCESLVNLVIPESVTSIGASAFRNTPWYESLTDEFVIVGDGCLIKYNGTDADVTIPDGVKGIFQAFDDNETLTSVSIPDGVTKFSEAFSGCTALASVEIPDSVSVIGSGAFMNCKALTGITIGDNITQIEMYAFYGCTTLASVKFGEQLEEIGYCAFWGCTALTEVDFPDSLHIIGDQAFQECSSLTAVKNGKNVIAVGYWAFDETPWMEAQTDYYVVVGKNVLIGYNGEETDLILPDTITSLGGAFSYMGEVYELTSIVIPSSVRYISANALNMQKGLKTITIEGEATILHVSSLGCDSLTQVNLPSELTMIPANCLRGSDFTSIEIPDTVREIGSGAFSQCANLTEITIPESCMAIGTGAFYGCESLREVTILNPDAYFGEDSVVFDLENDTEIHESMFACCADDLVIHGYAGSTAETYAREHDLTFEVIE